MTTDNGGLHDPKEADAADVQWQNEPLQDDSDTDAAPLERPAHVAARCRASRGAGGGGRLAVPVTGSGRAAASSRRPDHAAGRVELPGVGVELVDADGDAGVGLWHFRWCFGYLLIPNKHRTNKHRDKTPPPC